jgi:hypothetical protein
MSALIRLRWGINSLSQLVGTNKRIFTSLYDPTSAFRG